jgi:membrane protein DedA with SNARE-associated domain
VAETDRPLNSMLAHLLLGNPYLLMIPLALVEGPLVAMGAGAAAALGRISPWIAFAMIMAGALFQDLAYYGLGRWARASPWVHALATRTRLARAAYLPLQEAWRTSLVATLVTSKFAYGLYAPLVVSAGLAKAPFWRFQTLSFAVSALVLGAWFALGVGLVRAYGSLGAGRMLAPLVMAVVGLAAFGALVVIAGRARKRLDRAQPTA